MSAVFTVALSAVSSTHAPSVRAEMLPLWEVGAGAAAISFPDYRGSTNRHHYLLPIPTFVYRGELFQVDREKIRGVIYQGRRAELEVSINGSVPVRSNDNSARRGMPLDCVSRV